MLAAFRSPVGGIIPIRRVYLDGSIAIGVVISALNKQVGAHALAKHYYV
jgi:hypothetical protein